MNWKSLPTTQPGIFTCPTCNGRGFIFNKWRKKVVCLSCCGIKYLKECPTCKSMMQIHDIGCLNCILKPDTIGNEGITADILEHL